MDTFALIMVGVACYLIGVLTAPWVRPKLGALWAKIRRNG